MLDILCTTLLPTNFDLIKDPDQLVSKKPDELDQHCFPLWDKASFNIKWLGTELN